LELPVDGKEGEGLQGHLSDRIGRRPVLLIGAIGTGGWTFAFFSLLDTRSPALIALAMIGGLVFHSALYGPQAAFFAEQFDTQVRCSGMSLSAQVPTIVGVSIAPFIATALLAAFDSGSAIALYVLGSATLTTVAVIAAQETYRRNLATPRVAVSVRLGH
jgi:MFS family permease